MEKVTKLKNVPQIENHQTVQENCITMTSEFTRAKLKAMVVKMVREQLLQTDADTPLDFDSLVDFMEPHVGSRDAAFSEVYKITDEEMEVAFLDDMPYSPHDAFLRLAPVVKLDEMDVIPHDAYLRFEAQENQPPEGISNPNVAIEEKKPPAVILDPKVPVDTTVGDNEIIDLTDGYDKTSPVDLTSSPVID